ncbi:MAG: hypothetical protein ABI411_20315 [Tahibacter sp.]
MTRLKISSRPFRARASAALAAGLTLAATTPVIAQRDIAVLRIGSPQSGCAMTPTETVTIYVFNYGNSLPAGTSFNTSYTINAGAPTSELITLGNTLLSNSALAYSFVTQANLSVPGSYTFAARVSLAGDINPGNDASTGYVVINSSPSVGGTATAPPTGSSGTVSLGGYVGSITQWEQSEDGGQRWFVLDNQTTAQAFANLRNVTRFRARVRNGSCAEALSSVALATP